MVSFYGFLFGINLNIGYTNVEQPQPEKCFAEQIDKVG